MPNNINSSDTETLAREMRKPEIREVHGYPIFLVPHGYETKVHEDLLERPTRKRGVVPLHDIESFIAFLNRESTALSSTLYANVDYACDVVQFIAILNDHEADGIPHWRDYRAIFEPRKTVEWLTWLSMSGQTMQQDVFANFLEENSKDIATVSGLPTSAQILQMALDFQSKQEIIVKSKLNTQSGTTTFTYSNLEDPQTVETMQVFNRFAIGIAPYFHGAGFQLNARLKYRPLRDRLTFIYELERADLVLEKATALMIDAIRAQTQIPFFFGCP